MAPKIKYPVINGMKECGECHKWKPIIEYNKARRYYTAQCKTCRKNYFNKYRNRPENKDRSAIYHKEYKKDPLKREMINARHRKYNKTAKYKDMRNSHRRQWALREKQKAVNYAGGKCIICGYNKCLAAMDFHHKNPLEKDGYGGGALKSHWTFKKNKTEIDKCILVCVRCHREIHAGVINI